MKIFNIEIKSDIKNEQKIDNINTISSFGKF